jgi:hypothetical protein
MPSHPGVAAGAADATGAATITIQHNKSGVIWVISQMTIRTDPPGPLNVVVDFASFPCLTPTAMISGASAQGEPPISLEDHDIVYIYVDSARPNCAITVAYYYEEQSPGVTGGR